MSSAVVFISHLLTLIQEDNERRGEWEYGSVLKSPPLGNIMTDIITSSQLFRPSHSKHSPGGPIERPVMESNNNKTRLGVDRVKPLRL